MIVAEVPSTIKTSDLQLYYNVNGYYHPLPYSIRNVKYLQSKEEKESKRRLYRREYMKKPHVQEKIKARLNDPEVKKKRKEYSERSDVKERKKELSSKARAIRKLLKERDPEYYNELLIHVDGKSTDKV